MGLPHVTINEKGAQRVRAGHPWVFRSDIKEAPTVEPGSIVQVFLQQKFLGQAFFNPKSQISLRWITPRHEEINRAFWKKRLEAAIAGRAGFRKTHEGARLTFGEADLLPSLVIDQYRDVTVFQTLSLGMDRFREDIFAILQELLSPTALVERNDPPVRDLEGLQRQKGVVAGHLPPSLEIKEGNFFFSVDPLEGQKTGIFLDQADNHQTVVHYAQGRALDLFSYQGGFALPLSLTAQEVTAVDSSAPALKALQDNAARNGVKNITTVESNGFDFLREAEKRRESFDIIVLDPPPFVRDRKNMMGAVRGYKEINLRAMKLLRPGGILVTCSCSQNFTPPLFEKMLKEAGRDTHRDIQILERRGASEDHPVLLTFPESFYLQCWVLRVL